MTPCHTCRTPTNNFLNICKFKIFCITIIIVYRFIVHLYFFAVTIRSTRASQKFNGFIIQARRVNNNRDEREVIGNFTVIPGTKVICSQHLGVRIKCL